jgi:molybdopterin molybdotransferase
MQSCCAAAATPLPSDELTAVAVARQRMIDAVSPPAPVVERLRLDAGLGRLLADDVIAAIDTPPWANSGVDGYALRLADLYAAGDATLPVAQRIRAGDAPHALQAGTAARIFTGAPLPEGADAVVMQEHCSRDGEQLRIERVPERDQNVRAAGEDIRRGSVILRAGHRLRPQDIGLCASVGIAELAVAVPLRVAVLATGSELTAPGEALADGAIYDANGAMLVALLQQIGCAPLSIGRVPDRFDATCDALADAAATADLILTSGGVSVGDEDHVKPAMQALGTLDLWRIAVKPGKPLAFGRIGSTPLIGLPGNPISLFVTYALFAAPLIRHLQGRAMTLPQAVAVPAGFERANGGGRDEYLRVRLEGGRLQPYPQQGSGVLSSAVWCDGLARIPAGAAVTAGTLLDYYAIDALLG